MTEGGCRSFSWGRWGGGKGKGSGGLALVCAVPWPHVYAFSLSRTSGLQMHYKSYHLICWP